MSKLDEYIKLIPGALKNPKEVIEGWTNVIKEELGVLPEDILEEIVRRRLICGGCEFMSKNAKEHGYKTSRTEDHCILCSCPIKAKTASMQSVCGISLFNSTNPESTLEVKWEAYESDKG